MTCSSMRDGSLPSSKWLCHVGSKEEAPMPGRRIPAITGSNWTSQERSGCPAGSPSHMPWAPL